MFPPHYLGGYELLWRSAARHARRAGWDVRVLTTDYRDPVRPDAPEDEPDVHRELRWYWRDSQFPPMSRREIFALERHNRSVLRRHLATFRPDAVRWWAVGGLSLALLEQVRRSDVPAVGVVGDAWMSYAAEVDRWSRAIRGRPVLARVERLTGIPGRIDVAGAARWTFISSWLRETAADVADATIAHPGIDPETFPAGAPHDWGWRLASVGRIDPRKGIVDAIEALDALPAEATLHIDGRGDEAHLAELEARIASGAGPSRVTLGRSARSDLAAVYSAADALLFLPTWPEPWGLVPLEAMACGTPVIATGTGGSGEYLEHEANCLLVAPGDPEAVAAAVRRLAADEGLRATLRRGGLSTVARYTEDRFNSALLEQLRAATDPALGE
jgi:glycosyltransferase involved in cell wall biosynthesis